MCSSIWPEFSISQIADIILGGTPKTSEPKYWNGDIKWATAKDVANCPVKHIRETEKKITKLGLEESNAKLLKEGTIVITARGTVGEIRVLGEPMAFNQTCYGIIPKNDSIDNDFLYYALKNALEKMKALAYGTVFETVTTRTFEELTIPIPSLLEQRKIAEILGSLDDKIELNYEINKTLDAIAQAIFKNWFVDFEPFKDMLVYNEELGKRIPKGWEIRKISDVFNLIKGKKCDLLEKYEKGCLPYLLIETFEGGNIKYWTDEKQPFVKVQDIVLVADGERSGKVLRFKEGILGSTLLMLKQKDSSFDVRNYVFLLLKYKENELMRHRTGSAVPHLDRNYLADLEIIIPSSPIVENFNKIVNPLFEMIVHNQEEITTLSNVRDALLPKLLSGEIRVKVDVEREFPEESKKLEEIEEEKVKLQGSLDRWFK
jgi:type I restriction enzyme S subunit